jgi:hypothetical protein
MPDPDADLGKLDVLEILLDGQKFLGELFDDVEADRLDLDIAKLNRLAAFANGLIQLHRQWALRYALSDGFVRDLLSDTRDGLGRRPRRTFPSP